MKYSAAALLVCLATSFQDAPQGDDAPSIQKRLDDAGQKGGEVQLAPGEYRLKSGLKIPTGVALSGSWEAPHHGAYKSGTTLLVAFGEGREEGPAAIELAPSSAVRGLTIVYPGQKLDDVKPYPWTIHGAGMHGTVENVTLVNSYNGIAMGPEWNELHLIRNVFGCVLRRGILIDNTTDIGRIENVHFNPHYWARSGHPSFPADEKAKPMDRLIATMRKNLEAFIFGRTDWQYCTNTFVFGAKIGYKFVKTAAGACNGQFSGIGADGGEGCIVAEAAQPYGLLITNGQFVSFGGAAIATTETFDSTIQLSNCSFWGPIRRSGLLKGPGTVSYHQCIFDDQAGSIEALAGSLTVTSCRFGRRLKHVTVGPEVVTANITNNTFSARAAIELPENAPAERFVVGGNVIRPKPGK